MQAIGPFLFFLMLGAALISAELLIFNLSVFWFLFVGIGAIIAALFAWLVPESGWLMSSIAFVVGSALASILLYSPLRRWQQKPSIMPGNDALGQEVSVLEPITTSKSGKVSWSGTTWDAKLAAGSEALEPEEQAEIAEISGIILFVKKV